MRSRSAWLRSLGALLCDRLDRLRLTIAHVKHRLRHHLTEVLDQFVAETVRQTLRATWAHCLPPSATAYATPHQRWQERPWWQDADPPDGYVEEDAWEVQEAREEEGQAEEVAPTQPGREELAGSVGVGCETTACLLRNWPRRLSVPAALGVGTLAGLLSYVTRPWLGAGIALVTSGLQLLHLVQSPWADFAR